jgi:hypothetical protein
VNIQLSDIIYFSFLTELPWHLGQTLINHKSKGLLVDFLNSVLLVCIAILR